MAAHRNHADDLGVANGIGTLDGAAQQPLSQLKTMTGATAGTAGARGSVPEPAAGEQGHVLTGDGVWTDPSTLPAGAPTITSDEIAQETLITTSSTTPIVITGMTFTVAATGTYFFMFSAAASMNKNSQTVEAEMFLNGSLIPNTHRDLGGQAGNIGNFTCQKRIALTAGDTVDMRWYISSAAGGGLGSMFERNFFYMRLA